MQNLTNFPAPPDMEGLTWRPISRANIGSLIELAGISLSAYGGLGFLFVPEALMERFFPDACDTGIGAFTPDGRMEACAAVHLAGDASEKKAVTNILVRPDLRDHGLRDHGLGEHGLGNHGLGDHGLGDHGLGDHGLGDHGLGSYLVRWSQAQAHSLLADVPVERRVLQIRTESLTGQEESLYLAHGFVKVFDELVMKRDLRQPLPDSPFPADVTATTWQPSLARQFAEAWHAAFQERPGFPGWSLEEWIGQVTENDLVTEWTLLARAGDTPAGYVIGCIDLTTTPPGGFVWQIGVVPEQRRRGIASALLVDTMKRMQAAGVEWNQLNVHTNNPGAILAYEGIGFKTIGRRARFEKTSWSVG